jgi:hypothetical protein
MVLESLANKTSEARSRIKAFDRSLANTFSIWRHQENVTWSVWLAILPNWEARD